MLIFIAGPYSSDDPQRRRDNVHAVHEVARALMLKGHAVLECHSLEDALRDNDTLTHSHFMRQTLGWLKLCDAIYVVSSSPGAYIELRRAEALGLAVYRSLIQVPCIEVDQSELARIGQMLNEEEQLLHEDGSM